MKNNILYVVQGDKNPALYSKSLESGKMNWIEGKPFVEPGEEFECTAKFRYRQSDQGVKVKVKDDGTLHIDFNEPQKAVTPGQQVVLYKDQRCLGGAVIETIEKI